MLKRYGPRNSNVHPSSLSTETWTALRDAMPWTASHWSRLREQFEFCYRSGQWYGEVGTQFGARLMDREALLARLKLDLNKKTVLLFPHIFWDATFFWGRDMIQRLRGVVPRECARGLGERSGQLDHQGSPGKPGQESARWREGRIFGNPSSSGIRDDTVSYSSLISRYRDIDALIIRRR